MGLRLSVSNISKSYNGSLVLNGCSFSFDSGGTYAIMGPNGSGKSTFLRICALLENPDKGEVNYFSDDTPLSPPLIRGKSREVCPLMRGELKGGGSSGGNYLRKDIELRRRITLVLPKVGVFNTTVFKNVVYGLKIRGMKKEDIEERANKMLDFVGLAHKKDHNALALSSGETQRLGIARAMVIEPDIIFLDEPTTSIDKENTEIVEDIILKMKQQKMTTIILTTHNTLQAERLAERILFMNEGRFKTQ
ncbi:MAG: ATP-binding cassette domain-containing protein [Nitrospirae bacterium]|nr:ATP-binding cassette domain-containing protein [Nitrospirota bacterium]